MRTFCLPESLRVITPVKLESFPKAVLHGLLNRLSSGFAWTCRAWISDLGKQRRGVSQCQEGCSNFLHTAVLVRIVSFRVGLFASWYFELAAVRTGALGYRCRRADLNRGYEECERQTLKLDPLWLCLHGRQVRATRSFALARRGRTE